MGRSSPKHIWSTEEIEFLKVNYPKYERPQLLIKFNEHFNLNISDKSLKATLDRYHIKSGRTGQWQKGHETFNKGLKWNDYMSKEGQEKSRKTCFSSDRTVNNANHNELPVGTEIIGADGYTYIKVDKPIGNKAHKWQILKHHLIWEEINGPIPKGYNVIFADGNKSNFDINNLVLVSNVELAIINKNSLYYEGNAEATKCGVTIAKIMIRRKQRAEK